MNYYISIAARKMSGPEPYYLEPLKGGLYEPIDWKETSGGGSTSVLPTTSHDTLLVPRGFHTTDVIALSRDKGKLHQFTLTGEDPEIHFEDWLLVLKRAAGWNQWTPEENLLQLVGHMRGRALQEWG